MFNSYHVYSGDNRGLGPECCVYVRNPDTSYIYTHKAKLGRIYVYYPAVD